MKEILLWLFNRIGDLVSTGLTWKIYGDFSLFHFLLASLFLVALFKLFGFSIGPFGDGISFGVSTYKNSENKKDKKNYFRITRVQRVNGSKYITNFKVNRKTGDVTKL